MTKIELLQLLDPFPDDSVIMISDPSENAYVAQEVIEGTCYICHNEDDDEDETEVPAIYIQAVWEH